ncbi:hypothetical protein HHK36_002539 [Tetracentron sinense]|uniref:Uncharacterized protein n=1 Tax=Tetracentron sinense TaxID=13715 RepID=A0A834ZM79_TETSI|nr:hypothetical protein HHK36_002539 [Tetracentron sinense]
MEVVIPVPATDFNFDSGCSSPYISAPSSPKPFGELYFSAPTSPTRASAIYRDFNNSSASFSLIPFDWEEKPGKPKSNENPDNDDDDDFAFDFSGELERASLSAEELFDGGKIRPLKPPPRLQIGSGFDESVTRKSPVSSPRSPRSTISQGKKMFRDAFSPRHKKDSDPFAAAIEQTRKGAEQERGRERVYVSSSSNLGRRGTRSFSPLRVSEFALEEEEEAQQNTKPSSLNTKPPTPSSSSSSSSSSYFKSYRKWRLKDFLLFRSASEGRGTNKDLLSKYAAFSKKNDDVKNASFRSTDSAGSVSSSIRRGQVSAHELHYTANRAVLEESRRKTFLPYKQGLLGCTWFNPTVHGFAKGSSFLTRG